ncbi:hypothetical protein KX729_04280 [Rhizobium sp. XQZ8]|nr:hypothetical protein [Rhizobium populisoli]MBW6420650.1 hypothetical protein [Rhizobium populisoli]
MLLDIGALVLEVFEHPDQGESLQSGDFLRPELRETKTRSCFAIPRKA